MIDPKTLHEIERKIILTLKNEELNIDDLATRAGLSIDQVRRGIEWLRYKNLIIINEQIYKSIELGNEGLKASERGMPERRLVEVLNDAGGEISIAEIRKNSDLDNVEFNAAIANARAKGWIINTIDKSRIKIGNVTESVDEALIRKLKMGALGLDQLSDEEKKAYKVLSKRPNYIIEREKRSISLKLTEEALNVMNELERTSVLEGGRVIDVSAPAPVIYAGRKHPLQEVIDEVREVLVGLGFQEIEGAMVQNCFWNFDLLFTPQDHPAREMQDTFYISNIRDERVAGEDIISRVAKMHKEGWHYKLDINESKKIVLRTHTTPVTIRYLAENKPERASVFSVGRVFRNEKLTYKHLAEFYQVEGIMVGDNVTLRDLMGLQSEFYSKLGLKKVKFWPSYFPYTEPSLQSMVYNERLGKWVELFGMGIFRPEVTYPTGVKNQVLAWGGGLERMAMLKYELNDVRELYTNRLSWLRSVPTCR